MQEWIISPINSTITKNASGQKYPYILSAVLVLINATIDGAILIPIYWKVSTKPKAVPT